MLFAQITDTAKETADKAADAAKDVVSNLGVEKLIQYAVIAAIVVAVLVVLKKFLGRKKKPKAAAGGQGIDIQKLPADGPPSGGPTLEYFNIPVRVAAVVVAPAGNVRELPPVNEMSDLYDAITPGLGAVVAAHRPLVRRWPKQLSAKGFAHSVFRNCRLPGEGGKGSPWCCAAGVFKMEGQPVMAGLILRSDGDSSHGQQIMDEPAKWIACLRVK